MQTSPRKVAGEKRDSRIRAWRARNSCQCSLLGVPWVSLSPHQPGTGGSSLGPWLRGASLCCVLWCPQRGLTGAPRVLVDRALGTSGTSCGAQCGGAAYSVTTTPKGKFKTLTQLPVAQKYGRRTAPRNRGKRGRKRNHVGSSSLKCSSPERPARGKPGSSGTQDPVPGDSRVSLCLARQCRETPRNTLADPGDPSARSHMSRAHVTPSCHVHRR